MVRSLLIAITIAAFTYNSSAQFIPNRLDEGNQNSRTHVHSTDAKGSVAGMIDGAQHPELIPDSTAYRLLLITVSEEPNPTPEEAERQLAFLRAAGLDSDDIEAAILVLATFRAQYADLITRYNEAVASANAAGIAPDLATFLQQRDSLVQFTRAALASALSNAGMDRFHAHVQREKSRMKVAAKETQ